MKKHTLFSITTLVILLTIISACKNATANTPLEPQKPEATSTPQWDPLAAAEVGVAHNDEWKPYVKETNGVQMALVPAGCFMMGSEIEYEDELPVHEVCFSRPFWVDIYEVTNSQFVDYMNSVGYSEDGGWKFFDSDTIKEQFTFKDGVWGSKRGFENSAVYAITWFEAFDFCEWRGGRLPSEAEWEYTVRGPDNLIYPWGNEMVVDNIVFFESFPLIVGTKPGGVSWVGAFDLSANVYEWVNSIYMPYPYDPSDGREVDGLLDATSLRVLRGGSWYHLDWIDSVSGTDRFSAVPDQTSLFFGFRCAMDY